MYVRGEAAARTESYIGIDSKLMWRHLNEYSSYDCTCAPNEATWVVSDFYSEADCPLRKRNNTNIQILDIAFDCPAEEEKEETW